MKSIRTTLIAASLLAGLTGLAMSQTAPASHMDAMRAQHMEKMHAKMAEHHATHMAELKSKLKLEAGQETAWNSFSQAMQPPTKPMARPDRAAMEKLTTPERIDQMQALKSQRDAEMQKRGDAAKTFYASLNATQKKVFDVETARVMQKMTGWMGHGGGRPDHH